MILQQHLLAALSACYVGAATVLGSHCEGLLILFVEWL